MTPYFTILQRCGHLGTVYDEVYCRYLFNDTDVEINILIDDITLTVDGKDTYEEVKRMGRYR